MALNDLWKKIIRDGGMSDLDEDEGEIYRPNRRPSQNSATVEEPEDFHLFRRPRAAAPMQPVTEDFREELPEDELIARPKFKRVNATGMKSAEQIVDLVCQRYIVLVSTEQVSDEALTPFRCYLAGAVRALKGHISPIDDENVFVSIEKFDVTPYLPQEEEEELL